MYNRLHDPCPRLHASFEIAWIRCCVSTSSSSRMSSIISLVYIHAPHQEYLLARVVSRECSCSSWYSGITTLLRCHHLHCGALSWPKRRRGDRVAHFFAGYCYSVVSAVAVHDTIESNRVDSSKTTEFQRSASCNSSTSVPLWFCWSPRIVLPLHRYRRGYQSPVVLRNVVVCWERSSCSNNNNNNNRRRSCQPVMMASSSSLVERRHAPRYCAVSPWNGQ